MFAENKPHNSCTKATNKTFHNKKSPKGRPLKRWADQIRNDTRLPLLTAEFNTEDRTK